MMTRDEQAALVKYLEFLLVEDLLYAIINKHVADSDVVKSCFDTVYHIVDEINREIDHNYQDAHVDISNGAK